MMNVALRQEEVYSCAFLPLTMASLRNSWVFQPHPVFGKNSQMVMRNAMGQGSLAPFYMATDDAKSGSQ